MRLIRFSLSIAICVVSACSAAEKEPPKVVQEAPSVSESEQFLTKVAGVYKEQFQNGLVTGETHQSEDVLEVVPINDHAAYVRMELEFANGHSGGIFGVAMYANTSLVYDNGKNGNEHCIVTYLWSDDSVVSRADYEKTPGCGQYHGARGTLDGAKFSTKKRQDIGYLQRLKNSREFAEAMEEYKTRQK